MDIKIECDFKELVPIGELKPHPKNRNNHPMDQIEKLAKLFSYQGIRHPIIVSKRTGFIVAGHGRLEAAKLLKMEKVPVDFQDFENEEQEYAFLISDNAISLWAFLDLSAVNHDLPDLGPDFDLDLLGIKNFSLDLGYDLDEKPDEVKEIKKFRIEVQFPNDMEMNDTKDELLARGFIVRVL